MASAACPASHSCCSRTSTSTAAPEVISLRASSRLMGSVVIWSGELMGTSSASSPALLNVTGVPLVAAPGRLPVQVRQLAIRRGRNAVRIGMPLNYSGGFAETVAELADYEKAGLDIVFVPEAYSFDAVSQLGFIAARTDRLEIASGILQIYTRTPALTAMTAAGLDYVSGGRFTLGIGASGPAGENPGGQAAEADQPSGAGPDPDRHRGDRTEERGDGRGDRRGLAADVLLARAGRRGVG